MRILLLNAPHPAIGSRIPQEHLPPLGLMAIGGPLIDAGHRVELLDADLKPMRLDEIVEKVRIFGPDAILVGHSGSTSGHPVIMEITRAIQQVLPHAWIIYGGVFPTFHWREILTAEPQIDVIVRGEGEATVIELIRALEDGHSLEDVQGIAFRREASFLQQSSVCEEEASSPQIGATRPGGILPDLDAHRIGWELIDHSLYSYWGNRRAVVAQFSRGCPHHCHYCGQRGFWRRWRHRDPVKFAAELAHLHREHGVEVINLADENPTASRSAWKAFLEAMIAENVRLVLVGSTRADDIVRDADILHLYKKAGVARFLLGMESTDDETLKRIRKGSQTQTDREAIRLLRQHGILSMVACVAGFKEETDLDYWRTLRQIIAYDPDQIQMLYVTPHRWTPLFIQESERTVIQPDLSRWDYKHQVLATKNMPPWRIIFWVKLIEAVAQLRPKSLWRYLAHPDAGIRASIRWYYRVGRKVWPYEIWHFLFKDGRKTNGLSLRRFFSGKQSMPDPKPRVQVPLPRYREPAIFQTP